MLLLVGSGRRGRSGRAAFAVGSSLRRRAVVEPTKRSCASRRRQPGRCTSATDQTAQGGRARRAAPSVRRVSAAIDP
ncbi:hypothetical protein PAI11_27510 [Patulibacter medicamentivorans]|uniref:Uncharacterized protein n=1 Tax=Patulibacter medicamentivorans TaxID=1097667 RepID=H0E7E9_9ACTN|nr:hypothetical protein PAI11_27510 [Patulibacter medicamentivorans]